MPVVCNVTSSSGLVECDSEQVTDVTVTVMNRGLLEKARVQVIIDPINSCTRSIPYTKHIPYAGSENAVSKPAGLGNAGEPSGFQP